MTKKFENILETVGNTPVVKIGKLAPPGINLFVKIEAFNPLGSVKDRLALGVIEHAEETGELSPGQTVIEATSGNTGIGLAMVCAQTTARPMPVLPLVASTTVWPGCSKPFSSASSMTPSASLSFTDPAGLNASNFA